MTPELTPAGRQSPDAGVRYMAAVTLEPLLDRPDAQIPSIPAVTN